MSLTRNATLDSYGTFFTKDSISFKNTDSEPTSHFYICLNETQTSQLYEMIVTGITGEYYNYVMLGSKLSGYNTWRITFPGPVMPGEVHEFVVSRFFHGAMTTVVNSTGMIANIHHTTYPITPYYTDVETCQLKLPQGSDVTEYQPESGQRTNNIINFAAQNMFPFFTNYLHVVFKHTSVSFTETSRSIVTVTTSMQNWRVSNFVEIKNTGTNDLNSLIFTVPSDASDFTGKDHLGFISGIVDTKVVRGGFKNVTINLLNNRYKITPGIKFAFTFEFKLPLTSARVAQGDTRNALFVDLFQLVKNPWPMRNVEVRIALPQASYIDFNLLNAKPVAVDNQNGMQYLIYRQLGTALESSKVVTIIYEYSTLAMQIRPLVITLVVGLVATFLIMARKIFMHFEQPVVTVSDALPIEALKEFSSIFEEKVAAYLDLDTLNEDFQRRKIKKREYQIKVDDLTHRIKLLDNQIRPSKRKLVEFGGRFKEIIDELDLLETERQSVQDSLITLERRYKDGQIKSRVAYEQLYDNYASRLRRIQGSIDSGVNELKSYFS
ncbi:MAG: hypothetical protein Q6373_001520 [Candidatus Sigynarchaeota archaeon]